MRALVVTFIAGVYLAGCSSTRDYVKESNELSESYFGRAAELKAKNAALTERAAPLENEAINGELGTNKGNLEKIEGYPAAIASALKDGEIEKAKALYDEQQAAASTGIDAAAAELEAIEKRISDAEKSKKLKLAREARQDKFSKKLSTGFEVIGNLTGIEAQLVAFIEDDSRPVDKETWFNFDRLTFKLNSSELDMEYSKDQLTNIAEILKAFPKVELKIGGYTDSTGSAEVNKRISTERANFVAKAISELGVEAGRLDPEGYGPQHPVCPANDTEECRAQNRRIAVRVKAK